jgi:hypothetical protein
MNYSENGGLIQIVKKFGVVFRPHTCFMACSFFKSFVLFCFPTDFVNNISNLIQVAKYEGQNSYQSSKIK